MLLEQKHTMKHTMRCNYSLTHMLQQIHTVRCNDASTNAKVGCTDA